LDSSFPALNPLLYDIRQKFWGPSLLLFFYKGSVKSHEFPEIRRVGTMPDWERKTPFLETCLCQVGSPRNAAQLPS
jgi:hypothetical protein